MANKLAVCAPLFYPSLPLVERARHISEAGFGVLLWGWRGEDLESLAAIPDVWFSGMDCVGQPKPGSPPASMVDPSGAAIFMELVQDAIDAAPVLGCRELLLVTGTIGSEGQAAHPISTSEQSRWATAYRVLGEVAELAERHDLTFHFETLNTKVDHAGYPIRFVSDAVALLEAVGSPRLRLNFDVYHAQVEEGNLIELIERYSDWIGRVQVADVPGRHEPGTGEIRYEAIAAALRDVGYDGIIDLEASPSASEEDAMASFRRVFSTA